MPDQALEDAGWCMVVFSLSDMRAAEEALRDGKLSSYSVSNAKEKGLSREQCQERQRFLLRELPRGAAPSEERPLIVAWSLGGLRYTCELPKAGLLTPTEAGRFIGLVLGTAKDIAKQRKNIYNRIRIGALKQPKVGGKQMVKAKTVLELIDYYRRKAKARKDRETLRADRG